MSTPHQLTETDPASVQTDEPTVDLPSDEPAEQEEQEAPEDIDNDDLYHLLQNKRRRAVIRYLSGREQTVKMRDVAEQVAAWEHDTTVRALTSDQRQRVYIALYQSHLETLEDAGVIDYNKSRGLVDPRPRLEYVAQYVDEASTDDEDADDEESDAVDVWEQGYLSLSLVGSLLLAGTALNVTFFQVLSSFVVSVLILTMFSLLTLAKLTVDRTPATE